MTKTEQLAWLKCWYDEHRAALQSQPAMVSAIKSNHQVETIIHDLYLALYNRALGGCGSCLADALIVLYHYPEQKLRQIMECKFKLRAGVLLMDSNGKLPMATAANITDGIAIAYLRDNIARLDMFESYPDNIHDIIAGNVTAQNIESEQSHADDEKTPQIEENAETDGDETVTTKRKYTKRTK